MTGPTTPGEALAKARAWCARQERCQQEVRDKLFAWQVPAREIEPIIARLIGEGFLNEARFAEHFAVSKARQKGWGPRKIAHALNGRGVSEPCIVLAIRAIDAAEQRSDLERRVLRRWEQETAGDALMRRQRVIRHFLRKGFAVDEVAAALEVINNQG